MTTEDKKLAKKLEGQVVYMRHPNHTFGGSEMVRGTIKTVDIKHYKEDHYAGELLFWRWGKHTKSGININCIVALEAKLKDIFNGQVHYAVDKDELIFEKPQDESNT